MHCTWHYQTILLPFNIPAVITLQLCQFLARLWAYTVQISDSVFSFQDFQDNFLLWCTTWITSLRTSNKISLFQPPFLLAHSFPLSHLRIPWGQVADDEDCDEMGAGKTCWEAERADEEATFITKNWEQSRHVGATAGHDRGHGEEKQAAETRAKQAERKVSTRERQVAGGRETDQNSEWELRDELSTLLKLFSSIKFACLYSTECWPTEESRRGREKSQRCREYHYWPHKADHWC